MKKQIQHNVSSIDRRRRFGILPVIGVAVILLFGGQEELGAATTYYRWTDAQGKMVVSDRPPVEKDIEYDVVSQGSSLTRRVETGQGAVPAEVTPRPGNNFTPTEDRRNAIVETPKNPESCARARGNIETLKTGARIRIRDQDTGELRYLTEQEKEIQQKKAEDTIRVHCE